MSNKLAVVALGGNALLTGSTHDVLLGLACGDVVAASIITQLGIFRQRRV